MASLCRWKLSPPCRSNANIARGVDSREDVTATGAIDSGAVIPRSHPIPLQTLVLRAEMSLSKLSIDRADAKRVRALVRLANKFRPSRNLAKALLKRSEEH